ncbi:MAG: DUF2953 domain-containing protein [Tissierellia bacterium]|nr:DUF2953 domain-containing protein [Tissierellia bacterium]
MKYFFILAIVFLLLLLLPIKFRIELKIIENKMSIKLSSSYLFGLFSPEIYPKDSKRKKRSSSSNLKAIRNTIKELKYIDLAKYIWNRLHIEKLQSIITIGTTNPFNTSILYGSLWSVKGIGISYLLKKKDINLLDIDIIPCFGKNQLDIDFHCIIKIKMVYIINIWIKLLKSYKGGEKNVRTPNRRVNEIYNE